MHHLILLFLCCFQVTVSTRQLKMALLYHSHPSLIKYNMMDFCDQYIDLSADGRNSGAILSLIIPYRKSASNFSCATTVRAPRNYQVLISLKKLEIAAVSGSCLDYILIFDGGLNSTNAVTTKICGYHDEKHARSVAYYSGFTSSMLTVQTSKEGHEGYNYDFVITLTATVFSRSKRGVCPDTDQMLCDNSFCVWKHFKCNGYNNCGDGSDEKECENDIGTESTDRSTLRFPAALGTALIVGILIIMITSTVVVLIHKKKFACCANTLPVRGRQPRVRRRVTTVASMMDSGNQSTHGYDNEAVVVDLPPPYEQVTTGYYTQCQTESVNELPDYHTAMGFYSETTEKSQGILQ